MAGTLDNVSGTRRSKIPANLRAINPGVVRETVHYWRATGKIITPFLIGLVEALGRRDECQRGTHECARHERTQAITGTESRDRQGLGRRGKPRQLGRWR